MRKEYLLFFILILLFNQVKGQTTTVTYTSSATDFANPERGIYHHTETHSNAYTPLTTSVLQNYRTAESVTLILRVFYLDDFVSSPISNTYLSNMQTDFDRVRAAGIKCIVRFAYTNQTIGWPPASPYGDATKAWMLQHISQVEPYLQSNSDIIALVQTGFIGIWGEWYYTTYFGDPLAGAPTAANYADRKEISDRLLTALPASRMIQLRTPYFKYRLYRSGALTPVSGAEAFNESSVSRIGHHNDCFLASSTDFGTYINTGTEYPYLTSDTRYTPMGGETCALNAPRTDCTGDALNELSGFHYSFLNRDYINTVWNQWIAQGCSLQIKRNLGYRLQLNSGTYSTTAKPGGSFDVTLSLTNVGYASFYNPRLVEFILENISDGTFCKVRVTDDPRKWVVGSTINLSYQLGIPVNYPNGTYKVYLSMPDPMVNLYENAAYSVRLANGNTTWETTKGYNYLAYNLTINSSFSSPDYSGSLWFDNCYGALPVQWLDFDAKLEGNKALLFWSVGDESENDYFVVERSKDGVRFERIGKLDRSVISGTENSSYAFMDLHPHEGINYYRIGQYDHKGSFSFSPVKMVASTIVKEFYILPSPFTEHAFIHCQIPGEEEVEISIQDVNGKIISILKTIATDQPISIGKELIAGVYFVKIISSNYARTFKIIKTTP